MIYSSVVLNRTKIIHRLIFEQLLVHVSSVSTWSMIEKLWLISSKSIFNGVWNIGYEIMNSSIKLISIHKNWSSKLLLCVNRFLSHQLSNMRLAIITLFIIDSPLAFQFLFVQNLWLKEKLRLQIKSSVLKISIDSSLILKCCLETSTFGSSIHSI